MYLWVDQNHGTTYTLDTTLSLRTSTWVLLFNPDLAYEAARVTAYETRASNCPWTLSARCRHVTRSTLVARMENYGEDCLVNSIMGSTAVRGFQGDDPNHIPADRVSLHQSNTTWGYSLPRTGKDRTRIHTRIGIT